MTNQSSNDHSSIGQAHVLVSGTSTGIGEAIIRLIAKQGWTVFAGIRNQVDALRVQQINPQRIIPVYLDITKEDQINQTVEQICSVCGNNGLFSLINNAGIAVAGPLEFLKIEDIRLQMEVNFFGQVALTQACLPLLRMASGRIINISSISGRVASPFLGPYTASKHALEAYSDALRLELYRWGLKVILIEPGAVNTPIWEKSLALAEHAIQEFPETAHILYGKDISRLISQVLQTGQHGLPASMVAELVLHALTTPYPRPRYRIGKGVHLADLFNRFAPGKFRDWIVARLSGLDK